jgi:segregation and condensation protein B
VSRKTKKGASTAPAQQEANAADAAETSATLPPSGSEVEGSEGELAVTQDGNAEPAQDSNGSALEDIDIEATVNLTGDIFTIPGRDDLEAPTQTGLPEAVEIGLTQASRKHLRGLLEALVFASDHPIKPKDLAKTASAQTREVTELLEELRVEYQGRGIQLEEIAGGWLFRTSPVYSPFVRDLTKQKPVKLSRAQIETLAILAYRQPITRPEIDEIRGVDSGPVLKILLERDLVRILGKKDEPGRPLLYGTTTEFLEFFGLKSVKDLPTLREFTELSEDSRRVVEQELGETLETVQAAALEADQMAESHLGAEMPRDTLAPPNLALEDADSVHGSADDEVITNEHHTHDDPDEPDAG